MPEPMSHVPLPPPLTHIPCPYTPAPIYTLLLCPSFLPLPLYYLKPYSCPCPDPDPCPYP